MGLPVRISSNLLDRPISLGEFEYADRLHNLEKYSESNLILGKIFDTTLNEVEKSEIPLLNALVLYG